MGGSICIRVVRAADQEAFQGFFIEGEQGIEVASAAEDRGVGGYEHQHYQRAEDQSPAAQGRGQYQKQKSHEFYRVAKLIAGL